MEFEYKKIRKNTGKNKSNLSKNLRKKSKKKLTFSKDFGFKLSIFISIVVIASLFFGIYKAVKQINVKWIVEVAGDELETDSYNHTNFLILGKGGKQHEGANLTDTILVASLNDNEKTVSLLSIPRDLYVQDTIVGSSKINAVYPYALLEYEDEEKALNHTISKVEEILNLDIHYYFQIDFTGFIELIDALGGVTVNVDQAIYDPYYPKDGTPYTETFSIDAGIQELDGETALKYARSRKTTSDFDRSRRQQQILFAVKEKALETKIIFNKDKIRELLLTLDDNISTNVTSKEILTLGSMASDYKTDDIQRRVITDSLYQCGGFLFTPDRDLYGGQFVLTPIGGLDYLHIYTNLIFNYPTTKPEELKIHVLNGTKTGGVAGETKQVLSRLCFDITRFGNAFSTDYEKTTYFYRQKTDENGEKIDSRPKDLDYLQTIIPGIESTDVPLDMIEEGFLLESDVILVLGNDYVNSPNYINDPSDYQSILNEYNKIESSPTPSSTSEVSDDEIEELNSSINEILESSSSNEAAQDSSNANESAGFSNSPPEASTPETTETEAASETDPS